MMVAVQEVEHLLLRVLTGQQADTLGQGGRGVVRDNAQAQFQRSKAALAVVAAFLQRLIQTTAQFNVAEQGGDAAACGTFLALAAVILAVPLDVFRSLLGRRWLDVVDNRLQDKTTALVKELAEP